MPGDHSRSYKGPTNDKPLVPAWMDQPSPPAMTGEVVGHTHIAGLEGRGQHDSERPGERVAGPSGGQLADARRERDERRGEPESFHARREMAKHVRRKANSSSTAPTKEGA